MCYLPLRGAFWLPAASAQASHPVAVVPQADQPFPVVAALAFQAAVRQLQVVWERPAAELAFRLRQPAAFPVVVRAFLVVAQAFHWNQFVEFLVASLAFRLRQLAAFLVAVHQRLAVQEFQLSQKMGSS